MTRVVCLNDNFSTTRTLVDSTPQQHFEMNESFESNLFLERNVPRIDGGLRLKGYFKQSLLDKPVVTVIIAVFNGEKHLEETILSVINQTYCNLELLVIDGGSTDNTINILRKYNEFIDYWVSEKDFGISDAFNKGVRLALGDYINFQGDGDGFYDLNSVSNIIDGVNPQDDLLISGQIQRVSESGKVLYRTTFFPKFDKRSLLLKMSMPHQGLFTSIRFFKCYGLFDVNNKFCMDYELLLRAYHSFPAVVVRDVIVANWRADGLGNNRDLDIFKEYHQIKVNNKIAPLFVLIFINLWTVFKFHIKKIIRWKRA